MGVSGKGDTQKGMFGLSVFPSVLQGMFAHNRRGNGIFRDLWGRIRLSGLGFNGIYYHYLGFGSGALFLCLYFKVLNLEKFKNSKQWHFFLGLSLLGFGLRN